MLCRRIEDNLACILLLFESHWSKGVIDEDLLDRLCAMTPEECQAELFNAANKVRVTALAGWLQLHFSTALGGSALKTVAPYTALTSVFSSSKYTTQRMQLAYLMMCRCSNFAGLDARLGARVHSECRVQGDGNCGCANPTINILQDDGTFVPTAGRLPFCSNEGDIAKHIIQVC